MPGIDHKTPKNVIASIQTIRDIVASFGLPLVNVKPIVKRLAKIFEHRDKKVREEVGVPYLGNCLDH
jgi:cytoskeleton-associated protein 5